MTLCINLVIRFFSWLTLSLLTNRMSTLSTGPPLIKRSPPQFPLKLDKNDESFYYLAKAVLICGKRYAAQRWRMRTRAWSTGGGGLLLVKQYTIISQGHTGPHLPHKRSYKVLSTKTRTILWSCIIPPQAGTHST